MCIQSVDCVGMANQLLLILHEWEISGEKTKWFVYLRNLRYELENGMKTKGLVQSKKIISIV